MAKNDKKTLKLISPKGTAIYPKLNEPDTKFNVDGDYSVKLRFAVDDAAVLAFKAKGEALRDEFFKENYDALVADKKGARAKELKAVDFIKPETDPETGDETGFLILNAKMRAGGVIKNGKRAGQPWSQKPDYFNASGAALKNPPRIGGGSELKVSVELEPYLRETDKTIGCSVKLKAVQIITLREGGSRSASDYGFGAEEGDEIEDGSAPAAREDTGDAAPFAPSDNDDI